MRCSVASGTYIRSLARDIAIALKSYGHLTSLRRITIGKFTAADSHEEQNIPLEDRHAIYFYPFLEIAERYEIPFIRGALPRIKADEGIYRILCGEKFLGLGKMKEGRLWAEKVYPN